MVFIILSVLSSRVSVNIARCRLCLRQSLGEVAPVALLGCAQTDRVTELVSGTKMMAYSCRRNNVLLSCIYSTVSVCVVFEGHSTVASRICNHL